MLKCDTTGCENERAPGTMLCYRHWWGAYNQSPREAAEKLFETMDVVTQNSSVEVGMLEYLLFEAEKRGMNGKLPFSLTPAQIKILSDKGKVAQDAFNSLAKNINTITNRLVSALNNFQNEMAKIKLVNLKTIHGDIAAIHDMLPPEKRKILQEAVKGFEQRTGKTDKEAKESSEG